MKEKQENLSDDAVFIIKVMTTMTNKYGIDARSPKRTEQYVALRAAIIDYCRELYPNMTLAEIGTIVNRDHTAVMHSIKMSKDYTQNSKVGFYYNYWRQRILETLPLIPIKELIMRRALLGYL